LEHRYRVADHPVLAELEAADAALGRAEKQLFEQHVEPAIDVHRERVRPEAVERRDDPLEPERREVGNVVAGALRPEAVRKRPLIDRRELAELRCRITSHEAAEVRRELAIPWREVKATRVGLRM